MNFKKFISGVSALTIAASAFAAMAVTASAATSAFSQDFTAVEVEGSTSTNPADYGFTKVSEQDAYSTTTVAEGKLSNVAGGYGNGARGAEYVANFAAIGAGNEVTVSYTWGTGACTGNKASNSTTYVADSNGNRIFTLSYYGTDDSTIINRDFTFNGTTAMFGTNGAAARDQSWYVTARINMNTRKITNLTVTRTNNANVKASVENVDFQSADAANIAKLGFVNSIRASWTSTATLDDVVVSYEEAKIPAADYTVNYVASGVPVAEPTVFSGKNVGDVVNYSVPAYIVKDGTVYASGLSEYAYSKTMTETADSNNIEYTAINAAAQYVEYDGNTAITNANKASDGEMKNNFGADFETLTVAEDGIYTVTIGTGRTTGESSSTRYGTWKVNDGEGTSLMFSAPNPGPQVFENVELKANDVIKVSQANSKCALDYVLIVKTDDLTPATEARAVAFEDQELSELVGKTLYVTVNGETKSGVIPTFTIGTGAVNFAVVINDLPVNAAVSAEIR